MPISTELSTQVQLLSACRTDGQAVTEWVKLAKYTPERTFAAINSASTTATKHRVSVRVVQDKADPKYPDFIRTCVLSPREKRLRHTDFIRIHLSSIRMNPNHVLYTFVKQMSLGATHHEAQTSKTVRPVLWRR
jgi:hypothetical protein